MNQESIKRYLFFLTVILWGSCCLAGTTSSPDSLNNEAASDSIDGVKMSIVDMHSLPDSVQTPKADAGEISTAPEQSFLRVKPEAGSIKLSWEIANLPSSERVFLERSEDNRIFTVITEFPDRWLHRKSLTFVDGMVRKGVTYYYRLVSRSSNGKITRYSPVKVTVSTPRTSAGPVGIE